MTEDKITPQEEFWIGDFGNEYCLRNAAERKAVAITTVVFAKILNRTHDVGSILEFGANVGVNLLGLRNVLPNASLSAVEINNKAASILQEKNRCDKLFHGSIFDYSATELGLHDLCFTSGVLIHIHPDKLKDVYDRLYQCSKRYILINEYYNPTPVEVKYRGHNGQLYKRDFAGEILDRFPDLELMDYGFNYNRDPIAPQDDSNWFLFSK